MNDTPAADPKTAPAATSPEDIKRMREFLARVMRVPLLAVVITGNPDTDENTDILKACEPGPDGDWTKPRLLEKLCPVTASHIDTLLERGTNLPLALEMFESFTAGRARLYS